MSQTSEYYSNYSVTDFDVNLEGTTLISIHYTLYYTLSNF